MLSREAFDRYSRQVGNLADGAGEYVRRMVSAYLGQHPDASVAECRDFAWQVMLEAVQIYGDASATAAADYYDSVMSAAGTGAKPALLHSGVDEDQVEKVARYQAGKLVKGDQLGLARECAAYASDATRQAANRTMLKNALRDSKLGVRFARVPTGAETCTFCRMLASRGFDYKSEKTAGKFSHFHRNCDCRVVSSADAEGLEGYDPDREYDLWKKFEEIDAGDGTKAEKEAAKRAVLGDTLLNTRADPAVEYFGPAEEDDPEKLSEIKSWLAGNGIEVRVSGKDRERIGYSPGIKAGEPGQLIATDGMSLSAWMHEADHARYDIENGMPGFTAYLRDYKLREDMESRAYGVEISLAKEAGYNELVDSLQSLLREEIDRLEGDFGHDS